MFLRNFRDLVLSHRQTVIQWDQIHPLPPNFQRYPTDLPPNMLLPRWIQDWPNCPPNYDHPYQFLRSTPSFVTAEETLWFEANRHSFGHLWNGPTEQPFLEPATPMLYPYRILRIPGGRDRVRTVANALHLGMAAVRDSTLPPLVPPAHMIGHRYPLFRFHYEPNYNRINPRPGSCYYCFMEDHATHQCLNRPY